jgi:hypothetical protein
MWLRGVIGSQRVCMWPQGYSFCWQMNIIKIWEIPFIPTQSDACMSSSWLLGNAKSCKGERASSWRSKIGTSQVGEINPTNNISSPGLTTLHRKKSLVKKAQGTAGQTTLRRHSNWKTTNEMRLFTWNVPSLFSPGSLRMLTDVLADYRADTTAI